MGGLYKQTFDHSNNINSFNKPIGFSLYQNFPNPFNSSTTIFYKINHRSRVSLEIYDVTGKLVETILDTERDRGIYAESINLDKLSSGIYFYRLNYNRDSIAKK